MATALASKNRTRVTGAARVPAEPRVATRASRWLGHASFLLALAACGDRKQPSAPPAVKIAPAPVAAAPVTAPHGGRIVLVAATDRGDAAITLDTFGALRLWPALDGTYEPVVVRASAAKQLALAHVGKELVAAILDDAGGVEVLRFDGAGGLFGRAKLPFDLRIDEVVIANGHVIVKREDESLARYDTLGTPRGVLTPEPGQRVVSIDTRRDGVIVGLGTTSATHVRFVTAAFTWGEMFELPMPLERVALSPGHTRVIGFGTDGLATVVDLRAKTKLFAFGAPQGQVFLSPHGGSARRPQPPIGGFLDDDHVVASAPELKFASAAKPAWTTVERETFDVETHAAVGDVTIAGTDAGLVISGIHGDQHLGYRRLGGQAISAGAQVLAYGNREVFWLDDKLRATRVTKGSDLYDGRGPEPSVLYAVDDTHLVLSHMTERDWSSAQKILLYDVTTKTSTQIGGLPQGHSYHSYDRASGVVGFRVDKLIHRFRIDGTGTPLRPLADGDDMLPFKLIDPATANGVVAIVELPNTGKVRVYVDDGKGTGPLQPRKLTVPKLSRLAAIDRAGNLYISTIFEMTIHPSTGEDPTHIPIKGAGEGVVSDDGATLAFTRKDGIAVYDRAGTERWRALIERPRELSIRGDVLLVDTDSGIVTYDLRTGARLSAVCGWGFGLYDKPETSAAPNARSVCVDES